MKFVNILCNWFDLCRWKTRVWRSCQSDGESSATVASTGRGRVAPQRSHRRRAGLSVDCNSSTRQSHSTSTNSDRYDWCRLLRRLSRSIYQKRDCSIFIFYTLIFFLNFACEQARDGASKSASLIGRYCGTVVPPSLIGSTNIMWVQLVTGTSNRRANFVASLSYQESKRDTLRLASVYRVCCSHVMLG
jgi:hypothetical protein